MLSRSLIQFSVEGRGCVPSLLFDLRSNYGGGNEDNGDLLQKVSCTHCYTQCPQPCGGHCRPTPPPETPGQPWSRLGQSFVGSLVFSPGMWYTQGSVCALRESISQSCVRSGSSMVGLMVTSFVTWEVFNHSFNFSTSDWSVQIFFFSMVQSRVNVPF